VTAAAAGQLRPQSTSMATVNSVLFIVSFLVDHAVARVWTPALAAIPRSPPDRIPGDRASGFSFS
jgi:hypothetical protein